MKEIYLVTGIAGFIGSHIAEELLKNANNLVIGIDNLSSGFKKNLQAIDSVNLVFYEGDITDDLTFIKIFNIHKIKYIFHEAAISSVQKSINDPLLSNNVNLRGTLKLLNFAKLNQVKRIVFASSAAVFGDEPSLPKTEKSLTHPISPYGHEKLMSEQYMNLYFNMFGIETICLRYFNVYGPRQDPSSEYSGVISIFEEKFSKNECPVIYGDGENFRDFINVKDIVSVNLSAMHGKFNPKKKIFCCGTGNKKTINEIFHVFCEKYNKSWSPIYADARKGDIIGSVSDNRNMMELNQNRVLVNFNKGVQNL
jgi:nucleoside-diphosphate-sugar epimerase